MFSNYVLPTQSLMLCIFYMYFNYYVSKQWHSVYGKYHHTLTNETRDQRQAHKPNWPIFAPTGMAQMFELCSTKQKVTDSIPGQGICWGRGTYERQSNDVSLSHWCFSPSLPFPLKTNKVFLKKIDSFFIRICLT